MCVTSVKRQKGITIEYWIHTRSAFHVDLNERRCGFGLVLFDCNPRRVDENTVLGLSVIAVSIAIPFERMKLYFVLEIARYECQTIGLRILYSSLLHGNNPH